MVAGAIPPLVALMALADGIPINTMSDPHTPDRLDVWLG
jgi:hypothetical protein